MGKTIYLSENPNDFVWAIPEGKAMAFEKLIHAYLKRWCATLDGRIKVSRTPATGDAGRDFEVSFSGEIDVFGLHFSSHSSTGLLFIECKSTKNDRLDDGFLVDATQHKDAQATAYILVTNAVITPNTHRRAQIEWGLKNSVFCLVDRRRLADELHCKAMQAEATKLGLKLPDRSIFPAFNHERLVVSCQTDQSVAVGRQTASVFVTMNNYRDREVLTDLRIATDKRWTSTANTFERIIPAGRQETIELSAERQEFGGPSDLDLTLSVDGYSERLTISRRPYKVIFEPPFVGETHRQIQREIRTRAETGHGFSVISVQGEAGVGKSRTVQEALKPLENGQMEIIPFHFQRHQEAPSFKEFCERFELPDVFSGVSDAAACLLRLIEVARETAAPMIILFEDLHHADDSVIKVFKDLIVSPPDCSAPLVLILTGRDDHSYPNQAYYSLLHLVGDQELRHTKAYTVPTLNDSDAEQLIRSVVVDMPDPGVQKVKALGENNPFVIVEVLQYLLDVGLVQLLSRQTVGVLKPEIFAGRNGLPKNVDHLYQLRWTALSEAIHGKLATEFLIIASFFGFEISRDVRQAFFDGEETADECWALLCERRFVKSNSSGHQFTFAHENLLTHLQARARLPENAESSAALILDRPGLAKRLSLFNQGEVFFLHKDYAKAFQCFAEIWERIQQITNFSSEEINKTYFRYLTILFKTAKALKEEKSALSKVALANGYMGVHNYPLMIGEKACAASRDMLDELYKKSNEGLHDKISVRQLHAHALQNMGRIGLALREMLEIEAAVRDANETWLDVEFDLYDRLQAYYRRANHLELARFYGRQAKISLGKAEDKKLLAAHLITQSVVCLFSGEEEARTAAAAAHAAAKDVHICRFVVYTRLTELVVDTLYSWHKPNRLAEIFEEARSMLREAALQNFSDSIMRLDLLLGTLALRCFEDRNERLEQVRFYIKSGHANSLRFGNGLFDWAFDNLAAVADLDDPDREHNFVRERFRTCMERLRLRGLTFVGSQSGIFPNTFAISNAIRFLGNYRESLGLELIQMITAYDNDFLENNRIRLELVRNAIKGRPIFSPAKAKLQMIRYPPENGFFTPVF